MGPSYRDRVELHAEDLRSIGCARVRVTGVANAVADPRFAVFVRVFVTLVRVGYEGTVVTAVREAVVVVVGRLKAGRLVGCGVAGVGDAVAGQQPGNGVGVVRRGVGERVRVPDSVCVIGTRVEAIFEAVTVGVALAQVVADGCDVTRIGKRASWYAAFVGGRVRVVMSHAI